MRLVRLLLLLAVQPNRLGVRLAVDPASMEVVPQLETVALTCAPSSQIEDAVALLAIVLVAPLAPPSIAKLIAVVEDVVFVVFVFVFVFVTIFVIASSPLRLSRHGFHCLHVVKRHCIHCVL